MSVIKHRTTTAARSAVRRPALGTSVRLADAITLHREESREQAERWLDSAKQLQDRLDRYVSLYEDSPVGYVTLDARGVLIELNAAAGALFGAPRKRVLGKPFLCYVERADTRLFLSHLSRCSRGLATTELRLRSERADREPTPVQLLSKRTWFSGSAGVAYHTVLTNVTDRRRSEQAMRSSEKRHREIVETSSEGICIVNEKNEIVFVNGRLAAMAGGAPENLLGRSAFDLVTDEDVAEAKRAFARRDTGAGGQSEQRLRRLDGSMLWTSVSTSLMRDDRGQFTGMLRMYTDNTARRDLAQARELLVRQLVAAQEQERQRIARELHDQMGQHVVALSLGLGRLSQLSGDAPGAQEVVQHLQAAAELLGKDVHTLALELRPAALDHLGLNVALASYAEGVASRTGLEVDVHCDEISGLSLSADVQTVIYRIAQEALTNVVKHASARHVSVILERRPEALQLIVEDDGVGFNPNADGSPRLGLAGMRERASLIGAVLTIESTTAHGAAVYLRLPLMTKAVTPHEETTLVAR